MDYNKYILSVDEILPGLWLGNEATSQSEKFMKENKISLIVNASKNIPSKFLGDIHYIRVPVDDPGVLGKTEKDNDDVRIMKKTLPVVLRLIYEFRKNKKHVLIHCHAGAQRSAIIMAAYLLYRQYAKHSDDAIKKVIQKRGIAFFGGDSVNFRKVFED